MDVAPLIRQSDDRVTTPGINKHLPVLEDQRKQCNQDALHGCLIPQEGWHSLSICLSA